jgi:acylphosphatase
VGGFKAKIFGTVQGVGFRATTQQKAQNLNLKGWIMNSRDGTVEGFFEGNEEKLEKMKQWLKNNSPGNVTKVNFSESEEKGFSSFEIKY